MQANYHTHTPRCNHASGAPLAYAENGVKNGLELLGFSDHVPYPFSNGYHSGMRMEVSETEAYVNELLVLRESFRGKLKILIGYEAEYYPREFDAMLKNVCRFPCDYLILGQHFLGNEYDGVYSGGELTPEALRAYAEQCSAGLRTGAFSCLAHPDLPNFRGDPKIYAREMEKICRTAREMEIPLELNLFGLWDHRVYPNPAFWEVAADVGNDVILGCDAHWPEFTAEPESVRSGVKFLERYGLRPLEELPLRAPAAAMKKDGDQAENEKGEAIW